MAVNEGGTWATRLTRGDKFHPLVDYIVLAEFDIDTGSTVRHQFPTTIPDYKVDWFAEFMLPEGAHNRDLDYTFIFLNRDAPHVDQSLWSAAQKFNPNLKGEIYPDDNGKQTPDKSLLYGINVVKTRHDSSVRRGAIVKAMCVFSRYHFVDVLRKPLELALDKYFDQPGVDVLADLFKSLNAVNLASSPRPDLLEQTLMRRGVAFETIADPCQDHVPSGWYHTVRYAYEGIEVPLRIPLFRTPDEVGETNLTLLVKTFGEQVMRIFHAVLTKQRVLFVGYNHAASEVAQMVLSTVAMVSPPMCNIIRRAFPYSNLSDLSFLEVPGYVAGVTNPMFQQHDSWWDLLCILDLPNNTGHIYSAEERRKGEDSSTKAGAGRMTPPPNNNAGKAGKSQIIAYEEQPHYHADYKFVKGVISGINAMLGEDWLRQQFCDHATAIVNMALDQEQNVVQNPTRWSEKQRKFADANAQRIAAIRKAPEFSDIPAHPWVWCSDNDAREIEQALLSPPLPSAPASAAAAAPATAPPGATASSTAGSDPPTPTRTTQAGRPPRGKSGGDASATSSSADNEAELSPLPKTQLSYGSPQAADPPGSVRERSDTYTSGSPARAFKNVWLNLRAFVRKLQVERGLNSVDETQLYYQHFDLYLRTECALQALLAMMPQSRGGLLPIAEGLFHKSPMVRQCAMHVLQRLQQYPSTRAAYASLGGYFHAAFERQQEKEADGTLSAEIAEFNRIAKETRRGIVEGEEISAPSAEAVTDGDAFDAAAGALTSLVQGTLSLMGGEGSEEEQYQEAFSETIDELDLLR